MWPLGVLWGGFLESLGGLLGARWRPFGSSGDSFLMFLEIQRRSLSDKSRKEPICWIVNTLYQIWMVFEGLIDPKLHFGALGSTTGGPGITWVALGAEKLSP